MIIESFADLLKENESKTQLIPGTIVEGIVVDIRSDFIVVDAGLKSEGIIPIKEFKDDKEQIEVQIGDTVEVALDNIEDGSGATRLSREKAKRAKAWARLEEAHDEEKLVTGTIVSKVKGGFTVEFKDIKAFLPGSLVDIRPVRDTSYLEGKTLDFKVIKLDKKRNNVVVSRRAVLESEYSAERETLLQNLEEGQVISGTVKNLTDYGAFLDLGGVDGLLHITDMAWRRVKHPSEIVNIGDEIEVKILKFDRDRNRLSLGLKQLGEDPWIDLKNRYPVEHKLSGKVTNLTEYGCFVEIEPGIEGLVHISEMDWTNKNVNPNKIVTTGDEVEVMILEIDAERRRISLGMKQCVPNPWQEFSEQKQKGDIVRGKIKSLTDFGIFVELEGAIDGLIHLSDISWDTLGEDAIRHYKKGDDIEAMVLAVDVDRERISLGLKQLQEDHFSQYIQDNDKGTIVTGTVTKVDPKEAMIELAEGVQGFIRVQDVSRDHIEDMGRVVKEGDSIEAKIIDIDRKNRSIQLSIKEKEIEEEAAIVESYNRDNAENTPTLGDVVKTQLSEQTEESQQNTVSEPTEATNNPQESEEKQQDS